MIREVADAVKDLLTAPTALRTYFPGEVPNMPTTPYVVVYVERRDGGGQDRNRVNDHTALIGWRISTLYVGKSSEEAQWMHDRVTERLQDVRLPDIDGVETTRLRFENAEYVEADPGVENLFVGTSYWTCVSTALQLA